MIDIVPYASDSQLPAIMSMMESALSEPYSVYTYRYFIVGWPELCFLAMDTETNTCVGSVVCRLEPHVPRVPIFPPTLLEDGETADMHDQTMRGYIAMLAVLPQYRKSGIGSKLVCRAMEEMKSRACEEVVLETEVTNGGALRLYEGLGFVREKRLHRYYLNGGDAFRLKLWLQ
jgi:peptide alpha-N-acetyltransferase